ncbi:MAG: PadR family transcriptional regulator [Paenibacillus sp.]|nr:PadR family transcriptional regulator [Paenibacillus sp.]
MEFVILGFLMIRQLTQYEIRNALQQKVSPFFSASLGSIQAALKKLESNEHVELTEVVENGRRKKIYSLNSSGKKYYLDWMLTSIAPHRLDQEVSTKLFFLGHMSPTERITIVKAIITQLEVIVHEYESSAKEAHEKTVPEHLQQIAKYQLKTLDLGLFYYQSMLSWFISLITEMEAEC